MQVPESQIRKKIGSLIKSICFLVLIIWIFLPFQFNINSNSLAAQLSGTTYYVSPNGNDSSGGSISTPWKSIQKAANSMLAGDTVIILPGDYIERVQITKSGVSGASIIFQAQGQVITKGFNVIANYITIKGFEIANTEYLNSWTFTTSAGVYIKGGNNLIENNYIHDASLEGIYIYGTQSNPTISHDNIIRNNRLYFNGHSGIQLNGRNNLIEGNEIWRSVQCHPAMIAVEGMAACKHSLGPDADGIDFFGQGHILRNNYIHDISLTDEYNVDPHIDCFQTWSNSSTYEIASNILFDGNRCLNMNGNAGLQLENSSYLTIRNNIIGNSIGVNTANGGNHHLYFYNNIFINQAEGVELISTPYSEVKNNIFYNSGGFTIIFQGDKTGVVINYNFAFNDDGSTPKCIVVDNWTCLTPAPSHNYWKIDPKFVNGPMGDYHLQSNSPAKNAGNNLGNLVPNDLDGNSRPQGAGFDIGAFEMLNIIAPFNIWLPILALN